MQSNLAAYQFRLIYFDGMGVAETTRYLFQLRGKPFEVGVDNHLYSQSFQCVRYFDLAYATY